MRAAPAVRDAGRARAGDGSAEFRLAWSALQAPSVGAMTATETRTGTRIDRCSAPPHPHRRPEGQDFYTIGEVAGITGLSAYTLRWYERIGLLPHVDRSRTGQRRYRNSDLDWLDFVGRLRLTGMPVADMVRYAELVRAGEHTVAERRALLEATRRQVRARIAELQDTLAVLDRKIGFYARQEPSGSGGESRRTGGAPGGPADGG